ncbi:MAG: hypothetical protein OH316_02135 [Candidatus Parvarchaeota archaeon]|nr:hypothetical protein [Candidatus Parvarchaeota archaeon]MCW1301911.1 hypothetical protein [Candidatus Parvarchaeota archaeon]
MLLEIEGVLALMVGVFVLIAILRFIKYFYRDVNLSLSRIKLSNTTPNIFMLFLLANLVLFVLYSFSAGQENIKYGLLGVIIYTSIFGLFFLMMSNIIKGRKLNRA